MTAIQEESPKVSKAAIEAYRESVLSGTCDPQINFAARRLEHEWRQDRRTYEARTKACDTLKVEVPRMREAVADAAKALAAGEAFMRAVPDTTTVAELRAKIRAANPKLNTATLPELAAGLQFLAAHIHTLKSNAIRAAGALESVCADARRVLIETGDMPPDAELSSLHTRINYLTAAIEARQPIIDAERRAAEQRERCEKIARGDIQPEWLPGESINTRPAAMRRAYEAARRKLEQLLDLATGKADAEKANRPDQEELHRLQATVAQVQHAALLRAADPLAMRWAE